MLSVFQDSVLRKHLDTIFPLPLVFPSWFTRQIPAMPYKAL